MATDNTQEAKPEDLNPGQTGEGPKAPADAGNQPPEEKASEGQEAEEKASEGQEAPNDGEQGKDTEEAKDEPEKATEGDWLRTGDEVADTAIDLMKDAGVTAQDAEGIFGKAMQSGKMEDIDLAALEAKVGKAKANLVLAGIRDWHTRVAAKNLATVQSVHEVVGGEEAWASLREWAQKREAADTGFASEMEEYRALFEQGGKAAKFAAQELVNLYSADPNTKGLNNSIVRGDGKPAAQGGPLNRADYLRLVTEAENKGDRAEVARLSARRDAGRRAGL